MSCPAAAAKGPSWPQPVIRPYTSRGLAAKHSAGPTPRRSATPGRNPSINACEPLTSRRTSAAPAGSFRFTATERFPRRRISAGVAGAPLDSGRTISTTSAPRSARIIPAWGTGPIPPNSTTRTPFSGPGTAATLAPTPFGASVDLVDPVAGDVVVLAPLDQRRVRVLPAHLGRERAAGDEAAFGGRVDGLGDTALDLDRSALVARIRYRHSRQECLGVRMLGSGQHF